MLHSIEAFSEELESDQTLPETPEDSPLSQYEPEPETLPGLIDAPSEHTSEEENNSSEEAKSSDGSNHRSRGRPKKQHNVTSEQLRHILMKWLNKELKKVKESKVSKAD